MYIRKQGSMESRETDESDNSPMSSLRVSHASEVETEATDGIPVQGQRIENAYRHSGHSVNDWEISQEDMVAIETRSTIAKSENGKLYTISVVSPSVLVDDMLIMLEEERRHCEDMVALKVEVHNMLETMKGRETIGREPSLPSAPSLPFPPPHYLSL